MASRDSPEESYLESLKFVLIQLDSKYEGLIEAIKEEKSKLQRVNKQFGERIHRFRECTD